MELCDRLKNIYGKNNEEELIKSISNVRETLSGLLEERMCKVYSGFLLRELNNHHVPSRLINSLDLGIEYEHMFVLVPSNDTGYFLADLTFSQFNTEHEQLNQLLSKGYQHIDDNSLNCYLNIISKGNFTNQISAEDIFYSVKSFDQKSGHIKK